MNQWISKSMNVVCPGPPFPIQIISPRHGNDAYSYTLVWANPKTGGKPIEKYIIKYRKVTNDFRCGS